MPLIRGERGELKFTWNVRAISELTPSVILAGKAFVSIQKMIQEIRTLM